MSTKKPPKLLPSLVEAGQAIKSRPSTRGTIETLRRVYNSLIERRGMREDDGEPQELVQGLLDLLMNPKLPFRTRVVAFSILKSVLGDKGSSFLDSILPLAPPDKSSPLSQADLLLSLLASVGTVDQWNANYLCSSAWLAALEAFPGLRRAALPAITYALNRINVVDYQSATSAVIKSLAQWLGSASLDVTATDDGAKWLSTAAARVSDPDGQTSKLFTVLSIASSYSIEQLLNIQAFSSLESAIVALFDAKCDVSLLIQVALAYCAAIFQQISGIDGSLYEAVLCEAIRIEDTICRIDPSFVPKLYPTIRKTFTRHLRPTNIHLLIQCLQFLMNHGHVVVHSPAEQLDGFFAMWMNAPLTFGLASCFELMRFVQLNITGLSGILVKYSHLFFRIAAWWPRACSEDFLQLIPSLIFPSTHPLPLIHRTLDLPALAAAIDAPTPSRLNEYLMGGDAASFWSLPDAGTQLHDGSQSTSTRVERACELSLDTLDAVMGIVTGVKGSHDACDWWSSDAGDLRDSVARTLLLRCEWLYQSPTFEQPARTLLLNALTCLINSTPSMMVSLRPIVTSTVSLWRDAPHDLIMSLCWAIGEYGCSDSVVRSYYDALEVMAYEILSDGRDVVLLAEEGQMLGHVIVSALAKIAAGRPELAQRGVACLMKMAMCSAFSPSLIKRANQNVRLLKYPTVAAAVLNSPCSATITSTPNQTSLPFHVFSKHSTSPKLHEFNVE